MRRLARLVVEGAVCLAFSGLTTQSLRRSGVDCVDTKKPPIKGA